MPTQRGALKRDDNNVPLGWLANNITTKTTTAVKTSAGILLGISINKVGSTDTITVYDNAAATGTIIASITVQAGVPFYKLPAAFNNALTVVSGGGTAGDYTVFYI
jgi:hypothetical protein